MQFNRLHYSYNLSVTLVLKPKQMQSSSNLPLFKTRLTAPLYLSQDHGVVNAHYDQSCIIDVKKQTASVINELPPIKRLNSPTFFLFHLCCKSHESRQSVGGISMRQQPNRAPISIYIFIVASEMNACYAILPTLQ